MFPFVPRKVAQKSKSSHTPSASTNPVLYTRPAAVNASSSLNVGAETHPPDDVKGKRKTAESTTRDEDLAVVLWLSLTDHSLWVNAELRRALASADDGWLPLSTLHRLSAYFPYVTPSAPESAYVRAIRTHAPELLEVRMRVSAPSKAGWYGTSTSASASSSTQGDDAGGYEVRRKDWRDALLRARNSTRHEWEARTVYMECIPLAHRAVPSIYRFTTSLLDHQEHGLNTRIQAISLPAHHLDRPGDIPKPKGFALVTFSDETDAVRLASNWPWLPRRAPTSTASSHHDGNRESESELAHEAAKYGFRVLRKARWDELKEEYLAYRQRLLDEIAEAEASGSGEPAPRPRDPRTAVLTHSTPGTGTITHYPHLQAHTDGDAERESMDIGPASSTSTQALDPSAPFPPGCLVYVRHVHPETNKTTLKALFGAHAPGAAAALDYVDYNKGMATCHLRVSAPHHAQTLVSAFQARPLVQRQGLDDTGVPLSPDSGSEDDEKSTAAKAIEMEVVSGTREELYWSKVPEKVRREAVRKAIAQMSASERGDANGEGAQEDADAAGEHDGKRKRKRRRKA
ncbi:hypothetical protein GY45DRAFT_1324801 [Cubamyces sp. BRFM 1775]|nr:hypothetical protein GY45DRAFT_1324801 [Cubamyces sp. BRFM 1775]